MPQEIIRSANIADLEAVTALEGACFPSAEAAGRDAFQRRLEAFPHCLWLLETAGQLSAMIGGMTTDTADLCDAMYEGTRLYAEHGAWLMIFGVATRPEQQHRGLASRLMRRVIADAKAREYAGIVLTCKAELIPFYAQFGFVNEGVSASVHGGAVWYQMRLDLLRTCILQGEETHFYLDGERCLLYGWEQCDGFVLSVENARGETLWQTAPASREQCAVQLLAYMKKR